MIVGLGNPGDAYEGTRHNVGFRVLDALAGRTKFRRGFRTAAHSCRIAHGGEDLLLVKPQTFVNRSGEAVRALMRRHAIAPADLVVVVDDVALATGRLRIRKQGSAGGHNGLKSIIEAIGTEQFPRIRVGVGDKPAGGDLAEHVLAEFAAHEGPVVEAAIGRAADAVRCLVREGAETAMNRFNAVMANAEGDKLE
jgi:PTH1 family peptidyl-tRNA hydrolase